MKRGIFLLLIILFLFVGFIFVVPFAYAFPFGGFVKAQIHCANGVLLFVGLPTPGNFLLGPGSVIFRNFKPFIGHWLLGNASPGGSCNCPYGNCEAGSIPARGTILIVGTS